MGFTVAQSGPDAAGELLTGSQESTARISPALKEERLVRRK
jgi:hypothetical protein